MLVHFYKTLANNVAVLQVGDFVEEQAGVKIWAANDSWDFVYRIRNGKFLHEREKKTRLDEFKSSSLERDDALAYFSDPLSTSDFHSKFRREMIFAGIFLTGKV